MFEVFRKEIDWAGRKLVLETGKIARQADGAVLATYGETTVLCTVVGAKTDPRAMVLFCAVLAQPGAYKRVDWWDKSEGPLPNPDVTYPSLKRAAAFVCNDRQCSLPIFKPEGIAEFIAQSAAK